jgi:hypothetical protein
MSKKETDMVESKRADAAAGLLDQFAMAALTGIYAAQRDTSQHGAGGHDPHAAAKMAYAAARAMMAERDRPS